jgi:hypothetical protein
MLELTKNLIKEKEVLISKGFENLQEFKKEMVKSLELKTGVKFSVEEDYDGNSLIFQGVTEEGYLYFTVSLDDYTFIDLEDQTESQKYNDILWEIREELGL